VMMPVPTSSPPALNVHTPVDASDASTVSATIRWMARLTFDTPLGVSSPRQRLRMQCRPPGDKRHAWSCGADDRARTGDLDLGKVALYQLSYVRVVHQL
jgi:hypothetical protein